MTRAAVAPLSPSGDGSMPLANARHERFAKALVDNPRLSGQAAWAASGGADAPRSNKDALKATAHRVRRRPDVAARIAWLAKERRERAADGELTAEGLEQLMMRLSAALTRVHERAEAEGAPEGALLKLRRTLTQHAARFVTQLRTIRAADGPSAAASAERVHQLRIAPCRCAEDP